VSGSLIGSKGRGLYNLLYSLAAFILTAVMLNRPLRPATRKVAMALGTFIAVMGIPLLILGLYESALVWAGLATGLLTVIVAGADKTFVGKFLLPFVRTNTEVILV
jgi:uncharacterized membrane protein YhaH (DUF805 family)